MKSQKFRSVLGMHVLFALVEVPPVKNEPHLSLGLELGLWEQK